MENSLIQITENLSVVVVDIEAEDFYISGLGFLCAYKPTRQVVYNKELERGFEILGTITASEIDFDVEPYVRQEKESQEDAIIYKDYMRKYWGHSNKNTSFRSLLTSKGAYWENKEIKPSPTIWQTDQILYNRLEQAWQQAEQQKLQLNQKLIAIWRIQ